MRHVLVIRLSALGDVALMVPVLKGYADGNPEVRFTVAAPPMLQPLFEGMPNVEFLGLKKKQSFVKIYRALEAVGAYTVVDLHKVNRVGMALMVLRLRHLLNFGFHIYALRKGRLSRWLFLHHWSRRPRKHQYERYDDVFRRAGLKKNENSKLKIENSTCCKIPTSNRDFWVKKILRNKERDEENYRLLQENGWHVIVIWECQLKPAVIEHTMREVELLLNDNLLSLYKHHTPIPYPTEDEDSQLPLAAEEGAEWE